MAEWLLADLAEGVEQMKALFGAAEQRAVLPSTIVTERSACFLTDSEVVSVCKSKLTALKFICLRVNDGF